MKVDLDELRGLGRSRLHEGVQVRTSTLRALVAVVDAARAVRRVRVYGHPDKHALYVALEPLLEALEPFAPAADRAWEEVDRWNAERDLAVKAAVDATKANPRDRVRDQLADAGVAVQRQFRSDQERIAELQAELARKHVGGDTRISRQAQRIAALKDQRADLQERIAELERQLEAERTRGIDHAVYEMVCEERDALERERDALRKTLAEARAGIDWEKP